jgi:hypothetical protein
MNADRRRGRATTQVRDRDVHAERLSALDLGRRFDAQQKQALKVESALVCGAADDLDWDDGVP